MNHTLVELRIRHGYAGNETRTMAVGISDDLARELMGGVEHSDDALAMMLAGPGAFGKYADASTVRRKAFTMRRSVAKQIGNAMAAALMEAFGVNDKIDGYRIADMGAKEREYHEARGRVKKP